MAFRKRKSRFKKRMGRNRTRTSWRNSNLAPVISIGGIVLSVAALACLLIFIVIPILSGDMNKPKTTASQAITTPTVDPNAEKDMTGLEKEAILEQKSINNPLIFGNEMVYTTGEKSLVNPPLKNIAVYNLDEKKGAVLDQITANYNLFEPKMNEKWIVFLDVNNKGGGRVCAYDRKANKMFTIREYLYGMPKLSLFGDYVAWMQETRPNIDKLYICHLTDNESVILQTFTDTPTSYSAVSFCDKELIWVEKANPGAEPTEDMKCVIKRMPFPDGKPGEVITYDPQMFVFDPVTNGNAIVFLDGARGPEARLMISIDGALPKEIAKGILNYGLGNDVVAYTKDEAVYIYYIKDGIKGKLTGKNQRGELSAVNGDMVCWYDVTDGVGVRDVIKYAKIPSDSSAAIPASPSAGPSSSASPNASAASSASTSASNASPGASTNSASPSAG